VGGYGRDRGSQIALLNACAQGTHTDRLEPAIGRLLRGAGQEGGQEHGEAERQPEQLGGD
jgi:hypothetical protein